MGELRIALGTPLMLPDGQRLETVVIPTPLRAYHLLTLQTGDANAMFRFVESIARLPRGTAGQFTLDDYAVIQEHLLPLLTSFIRLGPLFQNITNSFLTTPPPKESP